jgi:hypothetical protein
MKLFKALPAQLFAACCVTISIAAFGCKSSAKEPEPAVIVQQPKEEVKKVVEDSIAVSALKDTGQQYFTVTVLKNNQPYIHYEGDFPAATFDGDNFTLQLAASKRILAVSHLLVLYFNGIAKGVFSIVADGNEKGKPSLIFTPEKDGNYGSGISADSGTVTITDYSPKSASGKITGKGKDEEGNEIFIKAEFINVKNLNLNH